MKFLAAVPAFLAAVALADDFPGFTNDIPVDASYKVGDDFVLTWHPVTGSANSFDLSISAWNNTPYGYYTGPYGVQLPAYDTKEMFLDSVPLADSSYTWTIETLDDAGVWVGEGFYYSFTAVWNGGFDSESPRAFHVVK